MQRVRTPAEVVRRTIELLKAYKDVRRYFRSAEPRGFMPIDDVELLHEWFLPTLEDAGGAYDEVAPWWPPGCRLPAGVGRSALEVVVRAAAQLWACYHERGEEVDLSVACRRAICLTPTLNEQQLTRELQLEARSADRASVPPARAVDTFEDILDAAREYARSCDPQHLPADLPRDFGAPLTVNGEIIPRLVELRGSGASWKAVAKAMREQFKDDRSAEAWRKHWDRYVRGMVSG